MSKISGIMVLSVTHGVGVSRKSGAPKPYDFCNITYLVPATSIDRPECKITNWGFETKEMAAKPEALAVLADCPKLKPISLLLETDPRNPAVNIVAGYELDGGAKP